MRIWALPSPGTDGRSLIILGFLFTAGGATPEPPTPQPINMNFIRGFLGDRNIPTIIEAAPTTQAENPVPYNPLIRRYLGDV